MEFEKDDQDASLKDSQIEESRGKLQCAGGNHGPR